MNVDEDEVEMQVARRTARKGLIIVLVGTLIVLALALVTVTDPIKYTVNYTMAWWIVAGIGSVITFIGMGMSINGEQCQKELLMKKIVKSCNSVINSVNEKQNSNGGNHD